MPALSPSGIGDGLTPTSVAANWGRFSPDQALISEMPLQWAALPGVTQYWSASIVRDFYIYEDFGNGGDTYLVVYSEDGTISPGTLISDQYLTGTRGDREDPKAPDLAQGFSHHRIDCSVHPSLQVDGVDLKAWSPSNVNPKTLVNNQVVSTVSESISITAGSEGASGGSSSSTSEQIWSGVSFDITEWDITDASDVGSRKACWTYYQTSGVNNQYWDGRNDPTKFSQWWEAAYDRGGGWDVVNMPPKLSTNTLKYHNNASWRFKKSLVGPDGTLMVTFKGGAMFHVIAIGMPQLQNNGVHKCHWQTIPLNWSDTFDLVASVKPK